MTTFDGSPSFGQFLTWKIGQAIAKRKEAKVANQATQQSTAQLSWLLTLWRLLLHVSGFVCLTYAGFTVSITAGYIVAGLSFFLLSTLLAPSKKNITAPTRDPMADRR